ncbi:MAG TPA: RnfABCDGE type electron transport complex subunit D [Thermoplasmata archaeon]|nr:RnfABCDGE type electron transport complex subunit D [Thermoplasmata archaeon]
MSPDDPAPTAVVRAPFVSTLGRWYRWWNPLRLLTVVLAGLAAVGAWLLGVPVVLAQITIVPLAAAVTDLAFSTMRWRRLRVPWAGIATGLFVALLIPPQGLPGLGGSSALLVAAGSVAVLAVVVKHLFRFRERPWVNPAAFALVTAGLLFGITPAWWGAVSLPAVLVGGMILNLRAWRRWSLPVAFFATYSGLVVAHYALLFGTGNLRLLGLSVLDPSVLFFTLFMLVEPRTAPTDPGLRPIYAAGVGVLAVLFGFLIPGAGTVVTADSLLLALVLGNLLVIPLRRSTVVSPRPTPTRALPAARARVHWGLAEQSVAVFAAFVVLAVSVSAVHPVSTASGPPSHVVIASCTQDNRTIPASTLSALHSRLGPSVIFQYDPNSGATVFYDPVNHVTVYETDLFEDYGQAEFNGDDSVLAQGCSLSGGSASGSAG